MQQLNPGADDIEELNEDQAEIELNDEEPPFLHG